MTYAYTAQEIKALIGAIVGEEDLGSLDDVTLIVRKEGDPVRIHLWNSRAYVPGSNGEQLSLPLIYNVLEAVMWLLRDRLAEDDS